MKYVVVALVMSAFAAGSAASASEVTDVDFLKANRCRGLATGIDGVVDTAALDSFIKSERRSRAPYVIERGSDEFNRARKEAKSEDRKARLTSELTGPCQAYLGGATSVAGSASNASKQ